MATLAERIMGVNLTTEERIPIHDFFAGLTLVNAGELTAAQIKTALNLTGQAATDFDWMIGQLAATSDPIVRQALLGAIEAIFILSERPYAGFTTPTDVQAKIVALLT